MAILGQIRDKPLLIISFVAGALLLFLIPFDSVKSFGSINRNEVGKVNGQAITTTEYNAALNQMQQQGAGDQASEQVWNQLIMNKLVEKRFNNLGLKMTDDVYWANLKSQGVTKEIIDEALKNPQTADRAQEFLNNRKNTEYQLMSQQYFSFLQAGILSNDVEVSHFKKLNAEMADISYVKVDYEEYNKKNPYKVSDEDLQNYINKHKIIFKRPASRNFYYSYFKNLPSSSDLIISNANMQSYLNGGAIKDDAGVVIDSVAAFKSSKGDSAYVAINSMQPYNPTYIPSKQIEQSYLGQEVLNWAKSAPLGSVYGPYKRENQNKTYSFLTKLVDKKLSDSIRSKHILIDFKEVNPKAQRTGEQANALADSILTALTAKPELFDALVVKYSVDGSKIKGGDVGYSSENNPKMVKEYQNYIENNPVGKLGKIQTQFGLHIIKVTQKINVFPYKYKLMNLVKQISPSDKTSDSLFRKMSGFFNEVKGKKLQDFVNIAIKNKYQQKEIRGAKRFGTIEGLGTDKDKEILKWAFSDDRKLGDIDYFKTNNEDFIVVYLNGIFDEGIATPALVRSDIEKKVRNEILAKKIADKINSSKKTLDQYAAEYGTTKVSSSINFVNPVIEGSGREPKVAGAAFGIKPNTVSKAIKGETGVYVIVTQKINTKPLPDSDKKQDLKMMENTNKQKAVSLIQKTMVEEADVKDSRNEVFQ